MSKQTVFKKVMVADRLPSESGMQITNKGIIHFLSGCGRFMGYEPQWWLEEVELPSEEEMRSDIEELPYNEHMSLNDLGIQGANYILNKLK